MPIPLVHDSDTCPIKPPGACTNCKKSPPTQIIVLLWWCFAGQTRRSSVEVVLVVQFVHASWFVVIRVVITIDKTAQLRIELVSRVPGNLTIAKTLSMPVPVY
jgi:hypothetical protein